jgi:hypothetical protein
VLRQPSLCDFRVVLLLFGSEDVEERVLFVRLRVFLLDAGEGDVFYDALVHVKCGISCAYREGFGTAKGPIGRSVCAFRLRCSPGIDGGSDLPCQVLSDRDNLLATVGDSCCEPVSDSGVDRTVLMWRQRVGRLVHACRVRVGASGGVLRRRPGQRGRGGGSAGGEGSESGK